MSNSCTETDLAKAMARLKSPNASLGGDYMRAHVLTGAEAATLVLNIERLQTIVRSVNRVISQNEPYRWKVERIVAALGETS